MKLNIGVLLIATGKYKQFVRSIIEGAGTYFLPDHNLTFCLFSDQEYNIHYSEGNKYFNGTYLPHRTDAKSFIIPPYKFPQATLYRYKIFHEHREQLKKCDYLFYMDVDMAVVDTVGDEILGSDLTAVLHPGYYANNGWGSPNNRQESKSFVPIEYRKAYYAGGFQGGTAQEYLTACATLSHTVEADEAVGIMAEWHDETHWNFYTNYRRIESPSVVLGPAYCMVEQQHLRKLWGIDHLSPKIIALAKDHKALRE